MTITNHQTGLKRSAKTDEAGRFNFPQLNPGGYSVRLEAEGFASQQNDNVTSSLGQKQTVDFTLQLGQSEYRIEVSGEVPLVNPKNANTSATQTAPVIENLPNPGGDMTYPTSPPTGLLGVGLGGDSSPRMVAFQARVEF